MKTTKNSFKGTGGKMLISLGFVLLMAVATWLMTISEQFNFGVWTPFVAALAPLIANAIKEFVKERK